MEIDGQCQISAEILRASFAEGSGLLAKGLNQSVKHGVSKLLGYLGPLVTSGQLDMPAELVEVLARHAGKPALEGSSFACSLCLVLLRS